MSRVPSSTVFTFDRAEIEQMIREAVHVPEGMCLERISYDIVEEALGPFDRCPGIPTLKQIDVHFAKLKLGHDE